MMLYLCQTNRNIHRKRHSPILLMIDFRLFHIKILIEMTKSLLFTSVLSLLLALNSFAQCNGCTTLCDKRYDEVSYLTTHNAYNSKEDGFKLPNQNWNISTQLNSGVRALMIDVYEGAEQLEVYHAYRVLGWKPFVDVLGEIKTFLDDNPQEVVTIILECYASADKILADFENSGLSKYLYTKAANQDWNTLEEMINEDTRLVVFTDRNDAIAGQEWYHYVWDYAVETHYSNSKKEDFSCEYNRGSDNAEDKDLFILNHFLTGSLTGVGRYSKSVAANANPYLLERIRECQFATGKLPNFITVDFYEIGDCKAVVDIINETSGICSPTYKFKLYPNPAEEYVFIEGAFIFPSDLQILTLQGVDITNRVAVTEIRDDLVQIDISGLGDGIYILKSKFFSMKFLK